MLLAAPWVTWAFVRTLGLDGGHPLIAAMAFTPYAAATSVVPLLVALVAREWLVAAGSAIALGALVVAVAPRAVAGPQFAGDDPPPPGRRLVVMSANLRFGEADPRSVMALVRAHDVDVLSVQELTPAAAAGLDAAGARERLPGRVLDARPRASGTGLLARRPLRPVVVPQGVDRAQLQVALRLPRGGGELRLAAVHPAPPVTRTSARNWRAVLRGLPGALDDRRPHILIGDFNATLDNRELRRLLARGYTDAADATGDGLRPTWPASRTRPPITIDHVLITPTVAVRSFAVRPVAGSDHRAVIAELVLPES